MTAYLMSAKEMPFTAADIRAELGLLDPRFDKAITSKIGSVVLMAEAKHKTCLRPQVWAIQRRDGAPLGEFFKAAHRIGKIGHVGAAYRLTMNSGDMRGVFHDVTFVPDYRLLARVKARIVNWCWDDMGISSTILRERRGEFRTEWPDYADAPALVAAE